jgi:hypothetical protein
MLFPCVLVDLWEGAFFFSLIFILSFYYYFLAPLSNIR